MLFGKGGVANTPGTGDVCNSMQPFQVNANLNYRSEEIRNMKQKTNASVSKTVKTFTISFSIISLLVALFPQR